MKTEKIAIGMMAIAIIIVMDFLLIQGINKNELIDCMRWKQESKEYSQYYLLKWQQEQCLAHGIVIETKIINN